MPLELRVAFVLALASALVSGCRCGDDRPYTPFGVASAIEAAAPAPSASVVEVVDAAPPKPVFAGKAAVLAPPGATRWKLGARELEAPAGRAFERAVSADFDQNGKEDVVSWSVRTSGTGAAGELWLHPESGAAKRLLALPGFVPSGPTCKHQAELRQTGPRTLTLDVTASCEGALLARTPKRALVVVAPLSERPQVVALRVTEAAPGEQLVLGVDSTDKDDDGRDDVRVSVSVSRANSRSASASLVWFDRAAGVSRDASEPRASLEGAASVALGRAKGKNTSQSVPESVESIRRLMSTLCAEGGVPRVFDADGAPISCGKLGLAVDRLALAETRAAVTRQAWLEALGALARDGWYFGKASDKTLQQMKDSVTKALSRIEPSGPTTLEARVPARGDSPRYSPLSFDTAGSLIVQSTSGVVTVSPDGREQTIPEGGVTAPPWPLEVSSEGGLAWTGVAWACDRNETLLTTAGNEAQPIVTSLLAPRPGTCKGGAPPKTAAPAPLGWKQNGLEAIVALAHVGPATSVAEAVLRPRVVGSPRSPDGRSLVAPTPLGLYVSRSPKPELWSIGSTDWTTLSDCAVANDAAAIACVSGSRVLVWRRP